MKSFVVETARSGMYVMENCGTFWAICVIGKETPRKVYHTGSERYIRGLWERHYKRVMFRQLPDNPDGCMEMYYE